MSVTNSTNKTLQDGDGVTVAFDFSFKIFKETDLRVYKITKETGETGDPLVLNTDYTVTINKVGDGGTVTFTVAPTVDEQAGIYRVIDITQPANIPVDTEYVEKTIENALDRACMIDQQLQEQVDRAVKTPTFSNITDVIFDTPQDGKATYWEVEDNVATLKNCETNPDDLVEEVDSIRDDCEDLKGDCSDLKDKCEDIKDDISDLVNAVLGEIPEAEDLTYWARNDEGDLVNMPLKSFEAYNTPFITNAGAEHQKVIIKGPVFALLELQDSTKKYYIQKNNVTLDVVSALDTGSALTAGKDYYIYLCWDSVNEVFEWKVSLNSTYPADYDEYTSRKLGGFHTLCVGVTAANAPQADHPAAGYDAGDIIPNSVWAYNFKANGGNAGKAYVDVLRKWCFIYNNSGTGSLTGSVYGATRTHTRTYHDFVEDLFTVSSEMIGQDEFSVCMDMSNYKTAVAGAAQPSPDTTGGHSDTAGKRMISKYFIEEGCGLQWQFTKGLIGGGGSGWSSPDGSGAKGQQYGSAYVVLAGGSWGNGGYTGPRCRSFYYASSASNAGVGGRGLSCHVEF